MINVMNGDIVDGASDALRLVSRSLCLWLVVVVDMCLGSGIELFYVVVNNEKRPEMEYDIRAYIVTSMVLYNVTVLGVVYDLT